MKTSLSFLLTLLITFSLNAQKAPIKWGKIDKADLAMTSYPLDPEAEALVLNEYGHLTLDMNSGEFEYEMKKHVRIKLLKKSAFHLGDISIPFYSFLNNEKIYNLKAQVILPNGEKISVSKKDFFEEQINKYWSKKKFALPSLQEGCIIEYQYIKRSARIYFLDPWYFQSNIPIRHSEFRTEIPEWFNYISFNQGLSVNREVVQEPQKVKLPQQRRTISQGIAQGTARAYSAWGGSRNGQKNDYHVDANIIKTRYYLENVPALKEEDYITTMRDYYTKLSLQLQSVRFPDSETQNINSNWGNLAEDLINDERFGLQINKKRFTKKLMAALKPNLAKADNQLEKVNTIYSFINENVVWNERYRIYCNSLDKAFEKKTANSAELNMMLIALCKQLDIKAYPVLISTRGHGKTMDYYPKSDQFNHVIAFVAIADKYYLFDVGDQFRSPDLLRVNSLNYKGWLVDKELHQWIDVPTSTDKTVLMATCTLDKDGNLNGQIDQSFFGYSATDERTAYHLDEQNDTRHKHIYEDWQKLFPDVEIQSIDYEHVDDPFETLKCKMTLNIPQAAQVSDDFIYLSPMLELGLKENLLKQESRTFPVDLAYLLKDQYILNLTIPEGYTIEELPEAINLKMDGGGGQFQFFVNPNGNNIQIISRITISKVHFEPEEYNIIKGFFDVIIEKHGEQIVLKKKT